MDIIDLPAAIQTLREYLNSDLLLTLFLCGVIAFAVGHFIGRTRKEKRIERKYETSASDETAMDDGEMNELNEDDFIPLSFTRIPVDEMIERSAKFYEEVKLRRSCRNISNESLPREIIDNIIRCAGTSPSGANLQPWKYVVVSSADVKSQLREIIEDEEEVNYKRRMGEEWVKDLEKFKTNWIKPYLTEAPYIILLFRQEFGFREDYKKQTNYYKELSSAISAGFLLMAIHRAGLVTVTTTPLNCGPRIRQLLNRPKDEKLILLFPVGYPKDDAKVPNIQKKSLEKILVHI